MLTIRPYEIDGLLDRLPAGIGTLSLDCFDTLIWRNTHAPTDVFAHLDRPGGGLEARVMAEGEARRCHANRSGTGEPGLADIHRCLDRAGDEATISRAVAAELAAEASHAFAFAPVVALIREAKARGMRVVIVSDMYLTEPQLRAHIAAGAGEEVLELIDQVFVSYDHGTGKGGDLFRIVLKTLKVRADTVVHMGDNRAADYVSAAAHGLHAVHLEQFDAESAGRLRQEAASATLLDANARVRVPICQPHRAAVALRREDEAAHVLGHDVLGPVFDAFARWVKAELDAMAARLGRPVKPLFLMRDGHLPFEAFSALYPDAGAARVEISRLVATRAGIVDGATLDAYLAQWLDALPVKVLAKQLMLSEREAGGVLRQGDTPAARRALARLVRQPELRGRIISRCRGFGDRLAAHLAAAGVAPGDAVMLVDLGYNGSVQNAVMPLLQGRLGMTVAGRYLLLRESQGSGLDKRGMLDTRTLEFRTLHAMAIHISVLEQLCTVAQGSTIDFTPEGEPIREAEDGKATVSAVRDRVQAGCVAFVRGAGAGVHRAPASDDMASRAASAAAVLARFLFLPNAREIALLSGFEHDLNLGTSKSVRLFDVEAAARSMRERGLSYINGNQRMFLAGEVHASGLPASLALFASTRFGLDLRSSDFEVGGVNVPVLLLGGADGDIVEATAYPTADGYYRLLVPVGAGQFVPAVQFGHVFEWVQVESVAYASVSDLDSLGAPEPAAAAYVVDGMEAVGPDLYRASPTGLMMVPPPTRAKEAQVLQLVFRPIRWRREAAGAVAIAA